jgi:hypothetical protein
LRQAIEERRLGAYREEFYARQNLVPPSIQGDRSTGIA